jgi:hypothetical protein
MWADAVRENGILICADTHVEDVLQRMADLKPDLVLVPTVTRAGERLA